jgi:P-type Mg2+ transporter
LRTTRDARAEPAFWARPIEELYASLGASAAGLTGEAARRRLAEHGPNVVLRHRRTGVLLLLASQFASPITVLLVVAAALSLTLGERVDGEIILGILPKPSSSTACGASAICCWRSRRCSSSSSSR